MFYMARDGDNWMKMQLHRVDLDGTGDVRLTDPAFNHSVGACTSATSGRGAAAAPPGAGGLRHLGRQPLLRGRLPGLRSAAVQPARGHERKGCRRGCNRRGHAEDRGAPSSSRISRPTAGRRSTDRFSFRPRSIRQRSGRRWCRSTAVRRRPATCRPRTTRRRRRWRSTASSWSRWVAVGAGAGQARPRSGLHEARDRRDGRHGGRHQSAVEPAVLRQGSRRHLRHVVRRLYGGVDDPAAPRRRRGGVRLVAGDRWYHYDSVYTERYMWIPQENKEGYEGGSVMNCADETEGPAAALLRHRRQQRPPEQLPAAHRAPPAREQELRSAGRARPGRTAASTVSG